MTDNPTYSQRVNSRDAHLEMLQSHKDAKIERRERHAKRKTHRKMIPIILI